MSMTKLDTRKLVVLSTAHLQRDTAEAADDYAANQAEKDGYEGHPLNRVAYGYLFVACGYPYTLNEDDAPELADCANFVGSQLFKKPTEEAYYLLFDCDGFTLDGLATYDWD